MYALWRLKMLKWIKSLFTKKKPLHLTPDEIIDLTLLTIHKPIVQKATTRSKTMATKPGLYANIHAKQERIAKENSEGKPVERMRKVGTKGAPTAKAFKESAKTAKK